MSTVSLDGNHEICGTTVRQTLFKGPQTTANTNEPTYIFRNIQWDIERDGVLYVLG